MVEKRGTTWKEEHTDSECLSRLGGITVSTVDGKTGMRLNHRSGERQCEGATFSLARIKLPFQRTGSKLVGSFQQLALVWNQVS